MYIQTIENLLEPYQKYPKIIRTAVLLVETHPSFSGLTRATKKVLRALVTRVSKDDGTEAIMARVDRLAQQANVSEKTVQRTLSTLQTVGWIKQISDGRSEFGVFTYRLYQFTAPICLLLRLPISKDEVVHNESTEIKKPVIPDESVTKKAELSNQISTNQKTEMSDGTYIDLSFKKDQQEISKKNRQGKIELPETLQPIIDAGVLPTGVAKLRGIAHEMGQKLEDVWTVAKPYIEKAKVYGNRVYSYLASMLNRPSDYKSRAAQIERMEITTVLADRGSLYRYKRYKSARGAIVRVFDGIAEVCRADGTFVMLAGHLQMTNLYNDIEAGILWEIFS